MHLSKTRKVISILIIPLGIWGIYSSIQNWVGEDALYHLIMSIFAILIGVSNLVPDEILKDDDSISEETNQQPVTNVYRTDISDQERKVTVLVTRNYSGEGLDKLEQLLANDVRITGMGQDEGRYHSVPDGDDLPEWFTLHIGCKAKHSEQLLKDVFELIRSNFNVDVAIKFQLEII